MQFILQLLLKNSRLVKQPALWTSLTQCSIIQHNLHFVAACKSMYIILHRIFVTSFKAAIIRVTVPLNHETSILIGAVLQAN